jgi:hypothetical protein
MHRSRFTLSVAAMVLVHAAFCAAAEPSPSGRGQGEGAAVIDVRPIDSQHSDTLTPTLSQRERENSPTAIAVTAAKVPVCDAVVSQKQPNAAGTAPASSEPHSNVRAKVRTVAMELLNSSGKRPVTKFGIVFDGGINQAAADRPLVVVIHGYNSCPERLAALQKAIRDAGFCCGTFRYPNDQAIADSALLLSHELRALKKQYPDRKLTLVTHSMGGLVAREAVENPALDPGNVSQLIMIAPPSHGTSCAYLTCSGDIWEHGVRSSDHNVLDYLFSSFEDGMGEGRDDLKPNSKFLKQLNDRPRNANVLYTIFLGTGTAFTQSELDRVQRVVDKCCQADAFLAVIKPALEREVAGLSDSIETGDGVVSVARGKLEGVSDTVLLGFDHWNVLGDPKPEPVAALHREILKRLSATP